MKELTSLQKAIEESRAAWPGPRWRCSAELRKEIVAYARIEVAAGASIRGTARQLGMSVNTLARWLAERRGQASSGFRPVQMEPEQGQQARRDLVLVSPDGYRVEGLEVEQVLTLLSRLR
jgi:transposase